MCSERMTFYFSQKIYKSFSISIGPLQSNRPRISITLEHLIFFSHKTYYRCFHRFIFFVNTTVRDAKLNLRCLRNLILTDILFDEDQRRLSGGADPRKDRGWSVTLVFAEAAICWPSLSSCRRFWLWTSSTMRIFSSVKRTFDKLTPKSR